jgi:hypothetical protein
VGFADVPYSIEYARESAEFRYFNLDPIAHRKTIAGAKQAGSNTNGLTPLP